VSVSTAFKQAAFAAQTGQIPLWLLTIEAESGEPMRLVNNTQNVTSRGQTFIAFPFQIHAPDDREDQLPQVQLAIDNVDRSIVAWARTVLQAPTLALELVLAGTPDVVEAGPFHFTLRDVTYDALVVTGTLAFENILGEPFPQYSFTPNYFPGIFAG
jgi:Domain of unknown function (DUF1833)